MQMLIVDEAATPLTLEEAEKDLRRLEGERDSIPARLAAAAGAADATELQVLRRRGVEIESELFAARVRALRLRLKEEEVRHAEREAELRERDAELVRVTASAQAAQDRANELLIERGRLMIAAMGLEASLENGRETIAELRAEIDHLVAHASGQGSSERPQMYGLGGAKVFGGGA